MWQEIKKNRLTWKKKASLKVDNTISVMNSDSNFSYETEFLKINFSKINGNRNY